MFRKHGYREQMMQGYLPSPNEVWPESFEGIKFSLLGRKKEIGSLEQISKEEERTSTCGYLEFQCLKRVFKGEASGHTKQPTLPPFA